MKITFAPIFIALCASSNARSRGINGINRYFEASYHATEEITNAIQEEASQIISDKLRELIEKDTFHVLSNELIKDIKKEVFQVVQDELIGQSKGKQARFDGSPQGRKPSKISEEILQKLSENKANRGKPSYEGRPDKPYQLTDKFTEIV